MARCLILNADDFGLTPGINRAIAELFHAGALTSTTLMPCGPAFDDAVTISRSNPGLGVGCHIVLTDGSPVCAPSEIPSLLGPDGKSFRASLLDFQVALLAGRIKEDEILREVLAQIDKLQRAGFSVTHVDTHKHTHIFPRVARPLLAAAERMGVTAVRNPFEESWSRSLGHPALLRQIEIAALHRLRRKFAALPQIRSGTVVTTDGTIGMSATGRLDRSTLEAILQRMPEGTWELVLHPGYSDAALDGVKTRLRETREVELRALLDVFAPQRSSSSEPLGGSTFAQKYSPPKHPSGVTLIHYGGLAPARTFDAHLQTSSTS